MTPPRCPARDENMRLPTPPALLYRYQAGEEEAATLLFGRYRMRLLGLARKRCHRNLISRVDPDDVVQMVFDRFFSGPCVAEGTFCSRPERSCPRKILLVITAQSSKKGGCLPSRRLSRRSPDSGTQRCFIGTRREAPVRNRARRRFRIRRPRSIGIVAARVAARGSLSARRVHG